MAPNKKFWTEFLELYRNLPALWRIKSDEYSNRVLKTKAYEIMINKLKEVEPDADREKVKRKINSFRSNYRRDLKRTKQSINSGDEEVFQSSLWYYDLLSFLEGQDDCPEGTNVLANYMLKAEMNEETQSNPVPDPPKKRKTLPLPKDEHLFEMACDISKEAHDDSEIQAKAWSLQYNQLSHQQKVFARKIISDVFYNGCLGRLDESNVREIQSVLDGSNNLSSP